ncbi:transglutaminase domain-containing protein, partial [Tahibacter amnicola]|uniref:transglutaminase domain-containing protein n=1 Tax=Tahibacter amnicola TaxID=2976241 RepID=UPI003CCE2507
MDFRRFLLATLVAMGTGFSVAHAQNSRDTELARLNTERARQAALADRDVAAGRAVLAAMGSHAAALDDRQTQAEFALRSARERAERLAAAAAGSGSAADAALRDLAALLTPVSRTESTAAPSAVSTQVPQTVRATSAPRPDPSPADLAATLDAPITPAIQALADELHKQPVAVFEWVRKHIAYVPSAGSLQGAQGTLDARRGNATDTASLLVALLRASGVPARYVVGTVDVDRERLLRWLGVDRIEAVTELFSEGGVPFQTVVVGGQVASVRFTHIWVEAWIDFVPSRGARHVEGDTWLALDPSFKELTYSPGLDLGVLMALDVTGTSTAISNAATVHRNERYLSALGADVLAAQLDSATQRLHAALAARGLANAPLSELLPRTSDATPAYPFFPGNLAYTVVSADPAISVLPDAQRHRLEWQVAQRDETPVLALQQPTVALAGKRVDLRFVPATDLDRSAIEALVPAAPGSFTDLPERVPAYLIRVRAELWLDEVRLAQSDDLPLGAALSGELRLAGPTGTPLHTTQTLFAGEPRSLALDAHGGIAADLSRSVEALRSAQQALVAGQPITLPLVDHVLRVGGSGHQAASGAYQSWLSGLNKTRYYRAPSATTAYAALAVTAPFGIVSSVQPAGLGLSDVSPRHLGAPLAGGNETRFVRQSLAAQSGFGHLLLEQLYGGTGHSAVRVFATALAAQQNVYTFAPADTAQLAALNLPAPIKAIAQAALAAGDTATLTGTAQDLSGWTGHALQIDYPAARGGVSLVYGTAADATPEQTGANVTTPLARGAVFTGWLAPDVPPRLQTLWQGELDPVIAGGVGLVTIAQNPLGIGTSTPIEQVLAGSVIDGSVRVDPLVSQHLWSLLVGPVLSVGPLLDPLAPVVALAVEPLSLELGQSAVIRASATDNRAVTSLLVTAAGDAVTLTNGSTTYTPTRAGVIPVIARARDAAGNLDEKREELLVRAPGDTSAPVVLITSPADDAEITQPVEVTGKVVDDSLRSWSLAVRPGNSPGIPPVVIASGTQAVDGVLGTLDPTLMLNGAYVLILRAEDVNGGSAEYSVPVRLAGDMKIGHFQISFEEVEVPLYGIPIRITRTYDTRQSKEALDFGYGWSVDYQNIRLRESRKLGYSWRLAQDGGGFAPFCVKPNGAPAVTVTLPDGKVEQFRARWSPECQQFQPPVYGTLVFEPVDTRTTSRLEQLDYGQMRLANVAGGASDIIDMDSIQPIDPTRYRLTTAEGMVYTLNQQLGIETIADPLGNKITYSRDGVTHSSGTRIDFVRDDKNRITDIVLPDARRLKYRYSAAGDLAEVKDQAGLATTFTYLPSQRWPHYLQDIIDARNIRAVRQEYNDEGRLVASVDAENHRIEYTHDIAGHTEIIKNRRGYATTFVYDDNGWVLSETNALDEQTAHTYDTNGNELTTTDPLQRTTTRTFDARGNVLTETNHLQQTTTRTWTYFNELETETDALDRLVVSNDFYRHPQTGEPTQYLRSTTNGANEKTFFVLDLGSASGNTGNLKSMTDASGATNAFEYDGRGSVIETRDAHGWKTTIVPDALGRTTKEIRRRTVNGAIQELVTEHVLDEKGQVKESRHPDGSTTKATYNAIGKIATSTDALGRVTHYTYTDRGEEERVTFPDATYTEKTYDEEGNVLTERDRDGRVTTMKYDAANRLKETIYPDDTPATLDDNPRTVNHYDKAGQLVGVTDARNQTTTYKYDDAGRQTHVINALQQTTETIYDKAGRREAVIDSLGRTTRFIYDAANRLTETIHPDLTPATDADNPRTFVGYDAAGRKVKETDEMGRVTRFAYDALGRLTQVILPNPANGANPDLVNGESPAGSGTLVTRYGYDELGNKLTQKDAEGRTTSWTFDKAQRPLTRTLPLGQTERFHYDALGRKDSHTDFRGRTTAFRYKPQTDYLETIDYPTDPDVTLTYTAGGELHTVQDANGTTVYANDVRGRLERVTWPVRPGEAIAPFVEYQYDANGNRTKLTTPNQVIDYQFDALNRLDKVLKGSEVIADYGYDGVGNRDHLVYANGTRTDYAYNLRNRLTGITHKAGTSLLLGVVYTVDASGLRTAIDETGAIRRHVDYRYDKVKRLENETAVAQLASGAVTRSTTWTYGKTGNRLTQSKSVQAGATSGFANTVYGYDANDRLDTETVTKSGTLPGVIAGVTRYTYDEAGNTIKKVAPDETVEYAYDDANRMSELKTLAGEVTRYAYNHAGIRLSQTSKAGTANAKTSHYLID